MINLRFIAVKYLEKLFFSKSKRVKKKLIISIKRKRNGTK